MAEIGILYWAVYFGLINCRRVWCTSSGRRSRGTTSTTRWRV